LIPVVKLGLVPLKVPPFAKVAEFVTESVCVVRDDRVRLGLVGVTILETVSDDTNSVEKEPLTPVSVCTVKEDKTWLGFVVKEDTDSVEKVPDLAPTEIVLIALELVMLLTSSVPPIVTPPVVSNVLVIISFEFVILELLKILMLPIVAVILLVKDALEA